MKAIQYRAFGGYEENRWVELPTPSPGDGEVLLRMMTVGINPLDNTFRSGRHPAATIPSRLLSDHRRSSEWSSALAALSVLPYRSS